MSYERRIIGFIDILGFGQLVFDSEHDSEKFNLISGVLDKINNVNDIYGSPEEFFAHSNYAYLSAERKAELDSFYESMKREAQPKRVRITTFSDSIVFSCPADSDGLINFRYFLIKLLVNTSSFNLLLRGGITCGNLVHTEQIVFGPAMNNAYNLESKVAKQPRIAIDEKFEEFISERSSDSAASLIRKEIIRDKDDAVAYFDSLCLATNKVAQNMCGANAHEILLNEKATIEHLLSEAPEDPNIRSKLAWYANYFNEFLERTLEVEVVVSHIQGMPLETIGIPVSDLKVEIA
ncbi:hypothetical protein [Halomonas halocynthiae]|uniref:hypothetical protein n=1 Tax=Halomonas halocynthiae TaxID=176290 RepID=UPI0003F6445D|nr:hypothetical protein [Halomonas halocynthiae]